MNATHSFGTIKSCPFARASNARKFYTCLCGGNNGTPESASHSRRSMSKELPSNIPPFHCSKVPTSGWLYLSNFVSYPLYVLFKPRCQVTCPFGMPADVAKEYQEYPFSPRLSSRISPIFYLPTTKGHVPIYPCQQKTGPLAIPATPTLPFTYSLGPCLHLTWFAVNLLLSVPLRSGALGGAGG